MTFDRDRSKCSGNNYRTTPTVDLYRMRDKMYLLSVNPKLTFDTRTLAKIELDYMDDLIAFRETMTPRQRAKLVRNRLTPWLGTWRREE